MALMPWSVSVAVACLVTLAFILDNAAGVGAAACRNTAVSKCPASFLISGVAMLRGPSYRGTGLFTVSEPATFHIASQAACASGAIFKVAVRAAPKGYRPRKLRVTLTATCPSKLAVGAWVGDTIIVSWSGKVRLDAWVVNYKKAPTRRTPPPPAPATVQLYINPGEITGDSATCRKEMQKLFGACGKVAASGYNAFSTNMLTVVFKSRKCATIVGSTFATGSGSSIGGHWKGRPWALYTDNASSKPLLLFQIARGLNPKANFQWGVSTSKYCAQILTVTKGCLMDRKVKGWCK